MTTSLLLFVTDDNTGGDKDLTRSHAGSKEETEAVHCAARQAWFG